MAINVSQAFHRTSANPVDESMALTKAQMLAVNDNLMPAYYFTICQDDGEIYLYDKTATPSASTGKFTKFEGGGGGGGTGEGVVITKTLLASGWNSTTKQQTLTFDGYDADMGGVVGMPTNATSAQKQAYAEALIDVASQNGNVFTFQCEEIPSVDLPVTLYAGGAGGSGSGVPAGGTTGQALVKKSNTDGDVEWKDVDNSVFEIHFANDAVDVTYSQLGEALSANKTLKLIDTANDVILAFTGYYSGVYYFSTICLNRRQEMINTSIVLYQTAPSSDVVATQVQRLTMTEDVQKTEMPTADSSYLNKIYQYIGTTDANFTNGLFYRCVNTSGTYSWQECETQHRLTPGELADIMSTLPGATTQYPKYSTTEQVVGEWIDGKPIYQKTVSFTTPSTINTDTNILTITNGKSVVDFKGIITRSDGGQMFIGSNYPNQSNSIFFTTTSSAITAYFRVEISTDTSRPAYITLEYTKTTD